MDINFEGKELCGYGFETVLGERYILNRSSLNIKNGFVEVAGSDQMIVSQTNSKTGKTETGFVKVFSVKGYTKLFIDIATGTVIGEISTNSDLGKTVVNSRSGLIL